MEPNEVQNVRLVMVGDNNVGKTCMLITYTCGAFPEEYIPKVFDNWVQSIEVDDVPVDLALCDTLWMEEHDRLRPRAYPGTDVVLIVFSVDDPWTLENACERWVAEVKHYAGGVPFILVGTKIDLREDEGVVTKLSRRGLRPVRVEDGVKQAAKIGAAKYMECSSLKQMGLKEIFEEAVRVALAPARLRRKSKCVIL